MVYILCSGKPRFFSSYDAAQAALEEDYFICQAQVFPVPHGKTCYSVAHRHPSETEVRFYNEVMLGKCQQISRIEVEDDNSGIHYSGEKGT